MPGSLPRHGTSGCRCEDAWPHLREFWVVRLARIPDRCDPWRQIKPADCWRRWSAPSDDRSVRPPSGRGSHGRRCCRSAGKDAAENGRCRPRRRRSTAAGWEPANTDVWSRPTPATCWRRQPLAESPEGHEQRERTASNRYRPSRPRHRTAPRRRHGAGGRRPHTRPSPAQCRRNGRAGRRRRTGGRRSAWR